MAQSARFRPLAPFDELDPLAKDFMLFFYVESALPLAEFNISYIIDKPPLYCGFPEEHGSTQQKRKVGYLL